MQYRPLRAETATPAPRRPNMAVLVAMARAIAERKRHGAEERRARLAVVDGSR
jgi:hypothetical protein